MIYIAGPYKHRTPEGVARNIEAARRVAAYYAARGDMVYCPHMHSARLADAADEAYWLRHGMDMLSRCDAIHLLPAWKKSVGSQVEALFARSWPIKRFLGPVTEQKVRKFFLAMPSHDYKARVGVLLDFRKTRTGT